MGSVKDLVIDKYYVEPTSEEFGRGTWIVSGRFSVLDLKKLIPPIEITQKAEALTMITARFFEWLANNYDIIETCYLGVLDNDGKLTDTENLLQKGQTSNRIVMKLAHTPYSFSEGDLFVYRNALKTGELECGVADVESIFRRGLPLGSSVFKNIFETMHSGDKYAKLSDYQETVMAISELKNFISTSGGLYMFPNLEKLLEKSNILGIPYPGLILKEIIYDSTTKFEKSDRPITEEEEKELSGLNKKGYEAWKYSILPTLTSAQIEFAKERNLINIDGKVEFVAYQGMPIVTDFVCTPDENRLMIIYKKGNEEWAIPTNKEIQRAIFRQSGIADAIRIANELSEKDGGKNWNDHFNNYLTTNNIDLEEVTEKSCTLMGYAIAEVANRVLEQNVFETKPLESYVNEFLPFASKITYQK